MCTYQFIENIPAYTDLYYILRYDSADKCFYLDTDSNGKWYVLAKLNDVNSPYN
jgi:hypothetical protein